MVLEVPFYISMKTIAFYNIKGGVGKSTSAMAFAQILHEEYGKRVLFIDIDKQANSTKSFGCYDSAGLSSADLLTAKENIVEKVIKKTAYGIDLIPANFRLVDANREVASDVKRPQQTRFKRQLAPIQERYDYCVIDFPIDDTFAAINALVVTDDILIPIKFDQYALDGMEYVINDVEEIKDFNDKLSVKGCFITMAMQNTNLYKEGSKLLDNSLGLMFLKQPIRQSVTVAQSSFNCPLFFYKPASAVVEDYKKLVAEYLALD